MLQEGAVIGCHWKRQKRCSRQLLLFKVAYRDLNIHGPIFSISIYSCCCIESTRDSLLPYEPLCKLVSFSEGLTGMPRHIQLAHLFIYFLHILPFLLKGEPEVSHAVLLVSTVSSQPLQKGVWPKVTQQASMGEDSNLGLPVGKRFN